MEALGHPGPDWSSSPAGLWEPSPRKHAAVRGLKRQIQNKMAENKHLRNIYCSEPLAGGSHLPVKFNVHICDQLFGR